jgi:ribosomal biogenesis protein LAS1
VSDNIDVLKEKLQSVLKSYVRARKTELKTRKSKALTSSTAAESALSALSLHTSLSNAKTRNAVLALLVGDRQILPATRKLGDNMSGAFLIWSPLLVRMSGASKGFLAALVEALGGVFSTQCDDAAKEAMYEWVVHVLTSADFTQSRKEAEGDVVQQTLETCFTHVTSWHLRVAEALLKEDGIPDRKLWETLLDAAKNESMGKQSDNGAEGSREAKEAERDHDAMEVETEHVTMEPRTKAHTIVKEKQCGPSKYVGMWKPRPIGALPIGWEVDTL